jgi:hypothetical protein
MPKTTPGVKPSSAFLLRFVRGRKPGMGILPAMPAELVQMIATFLPTKALGNLRLACKELESKTFWYFAREYFNEVKFTHSQYALQALLDLSNSRMGPYVRNLGLGPPSNDQGKIYFSKEPSVPDKKKSVVEQMSAYAEENRIMRLFGQDMVMIENILRNLSGVTTLAFINPCRGPISCRMHRSYGLDYCAKLGEGFAHFDDVPLDATQSMARLFSITLQAAETAKADIQCIDYSMVHLPGYYYDDSDFEITETIAWNYPVDFPKRSLSKGQQGSSFSNLANLKMHLGCSSHVYDTISQDRFVSHFTKFLSQTSKLHTLSFTMVEEWNGTDLLKRLTASPVTDAVRNFGLNNFVMNTNELISVLDNLPATLQTIELASADSTPADDGRILAWIRDRFTDLKTIRLKAQCGCGCEHGPLISYDGNGMTEFLNTRIRVLLSMSTWRHP